VIPIGYLAKRSVKRPEGLGDKMPQIADIYSVSSHVNDDFVDYIEFWKHNGYWLFDSPGLIREICEEHSIDLGESLLFFYEVYESEYDGSAWRPFVPEPSIVTNVALPSHKHLHGFDVVTFFAGNSPECSPLSCNGLADELRTNSHSLFATVEEALQSLEAGAFSAGEPGPYRIFAVYTVDWPPL
jgi:hypothetical protein